MAALAPPSDAPTYPHQKIVPHEKHEILLPSTRHLEERRLTVGRRHHGGGEGGVFGAFRGPMARATWV